MDPIPIPKPKFSNIQVTFEFSSLRKMLKMTLSSKTCIKYLKPLFSSKLDFEFGHMDIRVISKDSKKIDIPTNVPMC